MTVYILAKIDFLVAVQIESVKKFLPHANIEIVPSPMNDLTLVREMLTSVEHDDVLILTTGIILSAPLEPGNAVSYCVKTIVPKIVSWQKKEDVNINAIKCGYGEPFKTDYENLLQDEVEPRFDSCARKFKLRTFKQKFLGYMPEWGIGAEKDACWQNCLRSIDLTSPKIEAIKTQSPAGLGDIVATGLAKLGITKERISKAIGRDCGCAGRQKKLNELGKILGIGVEKKD